MGSLPGDGVTESCRNDGLAVLCIDHPHVQAILPRIRRRHVTYGLSAQADYRAVHVGFHGLETHFDAFRRNDVLGAFTAGC